MSSKRKNRPTKIAIQAEAESSTPALEKCRALSGGESKSPTADGVRPTPHNLAFDASPAAGAAVDDIRDGGTSSNDDSRSASSLRIVTSPSEADDDEDGSVSVAAAEAVTSGVTTSANTTAVVDVEEEENVVDFRSSLTSSWVRATTAAVANNGADPAGVDVDDEVPDAAHRQTSAMATTRNDRGATTFSGIVDRNESSSWTCDAAETLLLRRPEVSSGSAYGRPHLANEERVMARIQAAIFSAETVEEKHRRINEMMAELDAIKERLRAQQAAFVSRSLIQISCLSLSRFKNEIKQNVSTKNARGIYSIGKHL